ncbi:YtxH domain-containing protein [Patescibacteria group bacterium]|nr:YtxH domain-containing protein [Patescibacteria group bacterium]
MQIKKPKVGKKIFKILTGVVVGGAIGSILGLTLAPKKGKETRQYLREKSLEMFLEGKARIKDEKRLGFFKRCLLKLLMPKNKK